ncbi:MAG: hypothetical protein JWP57_4135, partial [Spirosoma sp.]|nr:hypothetical protein [Spirosoma sp.]
DNWPSPWRNELRPLGGVIHGTFVFAAAAASLCFLSRSNQGTDPIKAGAVTRRVAYLIAQVEVGRGICIGSEMLLPHGNTLIVAASRSINSIVPYIPDAVLTAARYTIAMRMHNKFSAWREQGLKWHVA